jgi:tetratricopeptide (TPR) repeat protein
MTSRKKISGFFALFLLFVTFSQNAATAQEMNQVDPKWRAAIDYRAAMAEAIANEKEYPTDALARLRQAEEIKGLTPEPDTDFAVAAIDIGHRLISLGNPAAAETFFRQADRTLTTVLARETAPLGNKEKVQYLKYRAHLRGNFLGRPELARADIDAAIALQPDDRSLQEARARLARGHGEKFKPGRN